MNDMTTLMITCSSPSRNQQQKVNNWWPSMCVLMFWKWDYVLIGETGNLFDKHLSPKMSQGKVLVGKCMILLLLNYFCLHNRLFIIILFVLSKYHNFLPSYYKTVGKILLKENHCQTLLRIATTWPCLYASQTRCYSACWLLWHQCVRSVKGEQHESVVQGH